MRLLLRNSTHPAVSGNAKQTLRKVPISNCRSLTKMNKMPVAPETIDYRSMYIHIKDRDQASAGG